MEPMSLEGIRHEYGRMMNWSGDAYERLPAETRKCIILTREVERLTALVLTSATAFLTNKQAEHDRDDARAEVEKLRDELERLTKHTAVVMACRDVAAAEIDHLRAKISEAHAALWGMYCAAGNLKDDVRQFERIAEDCIARAEYIEADPMVPTPSQDEAENIKTALLDILHGRQRPGPWLYDRVKEERDRLRSLVAECRPVVELVGALQARHAKQEDHINEVMALIEAKLPAMEGGE